MPASPGEADNLAGLRERCQAEHGVFWMGEGELGVFDPEAAQQVNAANFRDLTLPDRLLDLLRRRRSTAVSWKVVRAAWSAQLRRLSDAEGIGRLAARMDALLAARTGRPCDLVWAAQQVCSQALVPVVVDGLSPAGRQRVLRDQDLKLRELLTLEAEPQTFRKAAGAMLVQVRSGLAVRRELRGRARGRRPRRLDLADPIVDLLPELGMDRAVDAITAVLTAIAGPPGSVAACLVYELVRRPGWAARLTEELAAIPPERLYAAPMRSAPATHRFVKETLRMWTPPLLMTRPVRTDVNLERVSLKTGQHYFLSAYLIHHDPRHWRDPDVFDPDRWLSGVANGLCSEASYVPFGWAPRSCIGASLGTIQLILFCHLLCTRYRVQVEDPEAVGMALAAVPVPRHLHGTIDLSRDPKERR